MYRFMTFIPALLLLVQACNGSGGSVTPYRCTGTRAGCLNALAGKYEGTFSGDDSGTWNVEISTAGTISGGCLSPHYGSDTVTGTADETGRLVFGTVSSGSAFEGDVGVDFSISGSWKHPNGARGKFKGKRTEATGTGISINATDADGDGYFSLATGGDDCDDSNANVHPGAKDGPVTPANYSATIAKVLDVGPSPSGASVAIGPDGSLHTCTYDSNSKRLAYATNRSGDWVVTQVDAEKDAGINCDLFVDADGAVHIAYLEVESHAVLYATNTSGTWATERLALDDAAIGSPSIAVAGGIVYVAVHGTGLAIGAREEGTWNWQEIAEYGVAMGEYPSLAVSPAGDIAVAYRDRPDQYCSLSANGESTFARVKKKQGGDWVRVLSSPGTPLCIGQEYPSLAFDGLGRMHIAYNGGWGREGLVYMNQDGLLEVIDGPVNSTAIAADAVGTAFIGYTQDGVVKLAQNSGAGFISTVLAAENAVAADIALGPRGRAYVGYVTSANSALYVATMPELTQDGVDNNCNGVDGS